MVVFLQRLRRVPWVPPRGNLPPKLHPGFQSAEGTPEADEREVLVALIEAWDARHHDLGAAGPRFAAGDSPTPTGAPEPAPLRLFRLRLGSLQRTRQDPTARQAV